MLTEGSCQLLVKIACKEPKGLTRIPTLELSKERKERSLVRGLHRFAAENREAADRGIIKGR